MRALRLDFFRTTQGLAVTLLRRACAAWAHSLREVRVDVGTAVPWSISKSIYTALYQCPHLEVLCVPDIFVHIFDRDPVNGRKQKRPHYFGTLRHLELYNRPQSYTSWRVITRRLRALQTLVLRDHRPAPRKEPNTLLVLAAKANAGATKSKGVTSAAPPPTADTKGAATPEAQGITSAAPPPTANTEGVTTVGCAVSPAAQPAARAPHPPPRRWTGAAVAHRLPPYALHPPEKYDWHAASRGC
jgi:hypothetical protein